MQYGKKYKEDKMSNEDKRKKKENEEFIEEINLTWKATKLACKFLTVLTGLIAAIIAIFQYIQTLAK